MMRMVIDPSNDSKDISAALTGEPAGVDDHDYPMFWDFPRNNKNAIRLWHYRMLERNVRLFYRPKVLIDQLKLCRIIPIISP